MTEKDFQEMYTRESIVIGDVDGIPIKRARELFGAGALEYIQRETNAGAGFIGAYTTESGADFIYMTYTGARAAATYNNVQSSIIARKEPQNSAETAGKIDYIYTTLERYTNPNYSVFLSCIKQGIKSVMNDNSPLVNFSYAVCRHITESDDPERTLNEILHLFDEGGRSA